MGSRGDIKTGQLYTTPSCPQASPSPLGRVWQEQVQEEYYPLGQKAKERPQVMSVVVAYTCNRALKSLWQGYIARLFQDSLGYLVRLRSQTQNKSQTQWLKSVIPDTQEVEAGGPQV
jgi:hypothetical protein